MLLEHGVAVDERSSARTGSMTPCHLAASYGFPEVLDLLAKVGKVRKLLQQSTGNKELH